MSSASATISCILRPQAFGEEARKAPERLVHAVGESVCALSSIAIDILTFHALWRETDEDFCDNRINEWLWQVAGLLTSPLQIVSRQAQKIFSSCFPQSSAVQIWGDNNERFAEKTRLFFRFNDQPDDFSIWIKTIPNKLLFPVQRVVNAIAVKTFDILTLHSLWEDKEELSTGDRFKHLVLDIVSLPTIPLLFAFAPLSMISSTWEDLSNYCFDVTRIPRLKSPFSD